MLDRIKVASPCHARWEDMTGDDKSRFCRECEKHVYNFSAMSVNEVAELVRAKKGKLCGRFFRRVDGTMLTTNCPLGVRRYLSRLTTIAAGTAAALLLFFSVLAANSGGVSSNASRRKSRLAEKCEATLGKVKGWFGIYLPRVLMGKICILPRLVANPVPQILINTNLSEAEKP